MSSVIDTSAVSRERKERPATEVVTVPEVATTPMQVLAMAVQKGMAPETLDKMMGLQERWEANQARKAFDAAVAGARGEIKPIVKRRAVDFTNQQGRRTNYQYEDLAQIAEEVDPILSKYGLSYRHRSHQEGKRLRVTCIVSHRDGHFEETSLEADNDESGNKNSIQAIGSAATYLQRYTLKLALGLSAAKDDDGNGGRQNNGAPETHGAPSQPQPVATPTVMPLDPAIVSNGKHKGKKWADISDQYIAWAMTSDTAPEALKKGAGIERARRDGQAVNKALFDDDSKIPH